MVDDIMHRMTQDQSGSESMTSSGREPFLRRVMIKNYKSIGKCDVRLGRLSILVGRNGAGKSNFLDALRFIADGLQTSLDHATKSRGGIKSVRRHSTGHPHNFALKVEVNLPDWQVAKYGFEIAARTEGGFSVKSEELQILKPNGSLASFYQIADGTIRKKSQDTMPKAVSDRLYLVVASGIPEFRVVYDALTSMGFYNLNPETMKELQSPDAGELLHRDGGNVASVIARLATEAPDEKKRAETYLEKIVAGIVGVNRIQLGPRETIEFRQQITGAEHPWRFYAANMSDGTLRALGILLAASQLAQKSDRVSLVGIEEPETALHPAAARALMEALEEATEHTQVLLTTHSADLLDAMQFSAPDSLLAVEARKGETFIAPLDPASRKTMRDHLYSAGELLRMDQLGLDEGDLKRQAQANLFDQCEGDE
jgi:predicted ATPase